MRALWGSKLVNLRLSPGCRSVGLCRALSGLCRDSVGTLSGLCRLTTVGALSASVGLCRPLSALLTLLLQSYAGQSCCLDCGIGTIGIRNRNRTPGTQIFQETRFGGEQSDARAGAARFCQVMLLERSIHADASARRRVCGSRARATARPSWASLAAVRCAAARGEAISRCALGGRRTEVYLTWRDGLDKKRV